MNRLSKFAILASVAILAACTKVPAGNVGVKFDLYGGDKGVTGEVVGPGKYWLGWNEEMYLFPTFTQNNIWTKGNDVGSPNDESISFQDKEGTVINADVGISYAVRADKADAIFQKYRKGIDEITDIYLRNMVRDAINSETSMMDAADIYGSGKEKLMERVTQRVRTQVNDIGLSVEKIYWIGAMRLPANISAAINLKIEATQKAMQRENELQTAKAEAEINRETARGKADAVVTEAQGRAKANQLLNDSLSDKVNYYYALQGWAANGAQIPTYIGGGSVMIPIPQPAK